MHKRYLVMFAAIVALFVIVLILRPKSDGIDILISLKETNQRIAPASLSCPQWSYPEGSTAVCQVEGPGGRTDVEVTITDAGAVFADEIQAARALAQVLTEG